VKSIIAVVVPPYIFPFVVNPRPLNVTNPFSSVRVGVNL